MCDLSFDELFRGSNNIRYYPWVGMNYSKKELKILVVGESHYYGEICSNDEKNAIDNNNNFTRECYKDENIPVYSKMNAMLANDLLDNSWVSEEIAFYNFFQKCVGCGASDKSLIDDQLKKTSRAAFFEVLGILKPDIAIVWGVSNIFREWMPHGKEYPNEFVDSEIYYYCSHCDTKIFHITHPSSPKFDIVQTTVLIKEKIERIAKSKNITNQVFPLKKGNIGRKILIDGDERYIISCIDKKFILDNYDCYITNQENNKKMERIFFGVGQGAFYCERFEEEKIQVIYDCGSFSVPKLISAINDSLLDKNYVTILFISHFHLDHINGIPELIKKVNLKYIFFPYLTPEDRQLLIMYNKYLKNEFYMNDDENFITSFIENPRSAIKNEIAKNENANPDNEIELYYITTLIDGSNLNSYTNDSWANIGKKNSGEKLTSDLIHEISKSWMFIPYNLDEGQKREELIKRLKDEFGRNMSIDELTTLYKKEEYRKKIDSIFKDLGELNTNSMLLFSVGYGFMVTSSYNSFEEKLNGEEDNMKLCAVPCQFCGFLYTGDFNARSHFDEIAELTNVDWTKIDGIQIPHHGSKLSFTEKLIKENKYYIISADPTSYYHHPHADVIKSLDNAKILYEIVNDKTICFISCYNYELFFKR